LAVGADGRPWYSRGGVIAELTRGGSEQIVAHTKSRLIAAMTPAPRGEMWIADTSGRRIGRVSDSGATTYLTSRLPKKTHLIDLAAGAGGSVWATDSSGAILRISHDGVLRRFGLRHGADPVALIRGRDHAYWFSEFNGRRVGRISARGRVREFKIHDQPTAIAAGSDGALWVLTAGGSQSDGLERVTTTGTVQRFYIRQTCTVAVHGLLSARDGSLLLTEHDGPAAVVRLDVRALRRTHQFTSG
jgi:streptogramin lyase